MSCPGCINVNNACAECRPKMARLLYEEQDPKLTFEEWLARQGSVLPEVSHYKRAPRKLSSREQELRDAYDRGYAAGERAGMSRARNRPGDGDMGG